MPDHPLQRNEEPALADGHEARQELGHLYPREALLAGVGIADEEAERQREPRDVRERLAGTDRERRQEREDLAPETLGQLLELVIRAVLDLADDDPGLFQRRGEIPLPELCLARRELERLLADLVQRLVR